MRLKSSNTLPNGHPSVMIRFLSYDTFYTPACQAISPAVLPLEIRLSVGRDGLSQFQGSRRDWKNVASHTKSSYPGSEDKFIAPQLYRGQHDVMVTK